MQRLYLEGDPRNHSQWLLLGRTAGLGARDRFTFLSIYEFSRYACSTLKKKEEKEILGESLLPIFQVSLPPPDFTVKTYITSDRRPWRTQVSNPNPCDRDQPAHAANHRKVVRCTVMRKKGVCVGWAEGALTLTLQATAMPKISL